MRLLLDTHTFLWWINNDPSLSQPARSAISSKLNECYVSLASCWELAIKVSIGKLQLTKSLDRFIPEELATNDFQLLSIHFKHVAKVEALPFHHRDPFDRLIVAQALSEKMTLISADTVLSEYGVKRLW
ncbi:MAG TPA: type II toxin-antitoxin system VapC family toxin [Desulfuromonadales bacterium]|nr:type II toxin-antitoxin system VapC family toxin [Desulfuromonadales bacterium]